MVFDRGGVRSSKGTEWKMDKTGASRLKVSGGSQHVDLRNELVGPFLGFRWVEMDHIVRKLQQILYRCVVGGYNRGRIEMLSISCGPILTGSSSPGPVSRQDPLCSPGALLS
jgi:hypothetical protein